jgi:hypothetical protein
MKYLILVLAVSAVAANLKDQPDPITGPCTSSQNNSIESAVYPGCLARPPLPVEGIPFNSFYTPAQFMLAWNSFRTNPESWKAYIEWYCTIGYWKEGVTTTAAKSDILNSWPRTDYFMTALVWNDPAKYTLGPNGNTKAQRPANLMTKHSGLAAITLSSVDCCLSYLQSEFIRNGPWAPTTSTWTVPLRFSHGGPYSADPDKTTEPYAKTDTDPIFGIGATQNPFAVDPTISAKPVFRSVGAPNANERRSWTQFDRYQYLAQPVGAIAIMENIAYSSGSATNPTGLPMHPVHQILAYFVDRGNASCGHHSNLVMTTITNGCMLSNKGVNVMTGSKFEHWRGNRTQYPTVWALRDQCDAFYASLPWHNTGI